MCDDTSVTIINNDTHSETSMDVDTDLEEELSVAFAETTQTEQLESSCDVKKEVVVITEEETKVVEIDSQRKHFENHVQRCSAPKCNNTRFTKSDLSFFRFPRDEPRSKKWVINAGRKDLRKKTAKELFNANVLCADHFEQSQFTTQRRNRLKPGKAIPTIFDHVPKFKIKADKKKSDSDLQDENQNQAKTTADPTKSKTQEATHEKECEEISALKKIVNSQIQQIKNSESKTQKILEAHREKMSALKKVVDAQRKQIKRLSMKLSGTPRVMSEKKEIKLIKSLSGKYLTTDCQEFFCSQLDLSIMKTQRWSSKDKSFALSIFQSSPQTYKLLQKQFFLPSLCTLRRTEKTLELSPTENPVHDDTVASQCVDETLHSEAVEAPANTVASHCADERLATEPVEALDNTAASHCVNETLRDKPGVALSAGSLTSDRPGH